MQLLASAFRDHVVMISQYDGSLLTILMFTVRSLLTTTHAGPAYLAGDSFAVMYDVVIPLDEKVLT